MRKKLLTIVLFVSAFFLFQMSIFAQSKKELESTVSTLENDLKTSKNEIDNLKNQLQTTNSTINLLSNSNLNLENKITELTKLVATLKFQNDSILKLSKTNKADDYKISNPQNEKDSIIKFIQDYYTCENWADRLTYVWQPATVKKNMESYYSSGYKPSEIKKIDLIFNSMNFNNGDIIKVYAETFKMFIYIRKISNSYKLDWEATVGFNNIPISIFKANISKTSTRFRAKCNVIGYYNWDFRDAKDTHWSIASVIEKGGANCFVSKSSADGQKLYEILKDGKEHDLIIEIKYSNDDNTCIITKFIQEGWAIK